MAKILRLKKNVEFKKIYERGYSLSNRYLVLFFTKNYQTYTRVGFSTGKKIGNSVTRNRLRRLMKESFREYILYLSEGYDLVFMARMRMKDASYKDVQKAMWGILKKSKLLKTGEKDEGNTNRHGEII